MPSGKSTRRSLPFFETTDAPQYHSWGKLLTEALDKDIPGTQGTLAERPATSYSGRVHVVQGDATTANNGVQWWDTGSGWIALNPKAGAELFNLMVSKAVKTDFIPSSTRPTLIIATIESSVSATAGAVFQLNGGLEEVARCSFKNEPGEHFCETVTFVVPPATRWRWEVPAGVVQPTSVKVTEVGL